ncbi:hypothetical protein AB1L88_03390 [Tautonia sp. JC769]|uniref:hypothetical protein n=1 Tax=Tautonia sp. JC769 TaxID=3232135 RepID=UPI0034575771
MSTQLARRAGRVTGRWRRAVSRRPLLLVPLALAIMLAGMLGPDLFLMIPWAIRHAAGMVVFVGVVGLGIARLLWVGPGDRWVSARVADASAGGLEPILPWALAAATASLAWPMLDREGLGYGDWDFYLQTYEAVRKTVLDYGQFPWWNPWNRGGFPLAADPQCSLVPLATPLVLLLGTGAGLRLAAVVCLMIAVEGARRLARLWIGDPWASCAAGLVFGLHGGMIVYTVAGLYIPMTFCAMPWMILHTCRLAERPSEGLALGAWSAFNVLSGISYPTIYAFLIVGAFALRGLRVESGERRVRFLRHGLMAVGLMLLLAGWRLGPMVAVLGDFPRTGGMMIDLRLLAYLEEMLRRPSVEALSTVSFPIFWESNCYVGILGVFLLGASLVGNWRWWHWLALVAFALGLGSVQILQPSYWLADWPIFKTMHVVTRWRIAAMLGVGLAVADGVARLRADRRRWPELVAAAMVVLMGADLIAYGHRALPVGLGPVPEESRFPGPPIARPINVQDRPAFPNTLRGYGTIRGIQPIMGYDTNGSTARRWRGHPEYEGEFTSAGNSIEPTFWSPNRIGFRVEPHQEIEINQNPGSWWWVNGRQAFPDWRCAEWERPFVVRADAEGTLELQIVPVGLDRGFMMQGVGAVLLGSAWGLRRRSNQGLRDGQPEAFDRQTRGRGSSEGLP